LKRKKNSFGALPTRPIEDDQEVYDDVAEQDATNRYVTDMHTARQIRLSP
jgi:FYN binding protein